MAENIKYLEDARKLSIAGDYSEALACIEVVLNQNSNKVEALRLKGNIIELKVFRDELNSNYDFVRSPEILKARACYEQALRLQPNHAGVLVDLGTHWKNLGNFDKALPYFDRVIALQASLSEFNSERDDLVEALQEKIDILEQRGEVVGTQQLKQLLDSLDP